MTAEVNFEKVMCAFFEMRDEMNRFSKLWSGQAHQMDPRVATMLMQDLQQTKENVQNFENLVREWTLKEA